MTDALIIPKYYDRTEVHAENKLCGPKTSKSLLDHRPLLTLEHIADYHCCIMGYYKAASVISEWVRDLFYVPSLE